MAQAEGKGIGQHEHQPPAQYSPNPYTAPAGSDGSNLHEFHDRCCALACDAAHEVIENPNANANDRANCDRPQHGCIVRKEEAGDVFEPEQHAQGGAEAKHVIEKERHHTDEGVRVIRWPFAETEMRLASITDLAL